MIQYFIIGAVLASIGVCVGVLRPYGVFSAVLGLALYLIAWPFFVLLFCIAKNETSKEDGC